MANMTCKCGKHISTEAQTCPHCGVTVTDSMRSVGKFRHRIAVAFLLCLFGIPAILIGLAFGAMSLD